MEEERPGFKGKGSGSIYLTMMMMKMMIRITILNESSQDAISGLYVSPFHYHPP